MKNKIQTPDKQLSGVINLELKFKANYQGGSK